VLSLARIADDRELAFSVGEYVLFSFEMQIALIRFVQTANRSVIDLLQIRSSEILLCHASF
jgi:hypothetical protein